MVGIGIPIYNDLISKNEEDIDIYEVVCDLISSIEKYTDDEILLIVRDNNSLDFRFSHFNVTLKRWFSHLNYIFLSDEKPSLTDGWNTILSTSFELGCEAVALINQDIIVTKYWQNFINAIKIQGNNLLTPLMTAAPYQPLQICEEDVFTPVNALISIPIIQGCCFGGSKKAFKENMYDSEHFFNPAYEFGYNEVEWQLRNKGKSLVVQNSLVIHLSQYSWAGIDNSNGSNPTHRDRDKVLETLSYSQYIRG